MAIDLGGKRTGLAIGDDITMQAGPVDVIHTADPTELRRAIRRAIDEHGPDALVIGIPLNMDGTEGPAAKKALAMARDITLDTGMTIHFVDERLTSFEAEHLIRDLELTRKQKKQRLDALAATAILRDFLARKQSPSD
jgi:putative Holliday junction resolvase